MLSSCPVIFSKKRAIEAGAGTGLDHSVATLPFGEITRLTYLANSLSGTQNFSIIGIGAPTQFTYLANSLSGSQNFVVLQDSFTAFSYTPSGIDALTPSPIALSSEVAAYSPAGVDAATAVPIATSSTVAEYNGQGADSSVVIPVQVV
jgi:hypothetical protein